MPISVILNDQKLSSEVEYSRVRQSHYDVVWLAKARQKSLVALKDESKENSSTLNSKRVFDAKVCAVEFKFYIYTGGAINESALLNCPVEASI